MTGYWQRLRNVLKKIAARRARKYSQGFIERVGPEEVSGWVNWSGEQPPELQFVCRGSRYDIDVSWHERPDVQVQVPGAPARTGFSFPLPPEAFAALGRGAPSRKAVDVIAGGKPVQLLGLHVINVPTLQAEDVANNIAVDEGPRTPLFRALPGDAGGTKATVTLSTTQGFRLVAAISGAAGSLDGLRLVCDGKSLAPTTIATLPGNVREATFELPGYWWTAGTAGAGMPLQLQLAGTLLPAEPVRLTLDWAVQALQRAARRGARGSYEQLLFLEHAHFIDALAKLPEGVRAWLQTVAKSHGLDDYLRAAAPAVTGEDADEVARQQLIAALREYSRRMPQARGDEYALLRDVEASLPGERQREYLRESAMPWFFRERRLADVRRFVTPTHQRRLSKAASVWHSSLILPLLVADGEVDRATEIVRSLVGKTGWVVTESLAEATRQALAMSGRTPAVEKFGAALFALVENWCFDYWSRKEDVELIDVCVAWLVPSARFSLRFRNDMLAIVLRAYGLSPRFWDRLQPLLVADDPLHVSLRVAGERFRRLAGAVHALAPGAPFPPHLRDDLAFFRRLGNHDAPRFLREIAVAHALRSDDDSATAGALVEDLLALGDSEAVRLAALPTTHAWLPPLEAASLPTRVLAMQRSVPRTPYGTLQKRLARQVEDFPSIAADATALSGFIAAAETLGRDQACHLSVDVLAAAWCADARPSPSLTDALARHLQQASAAAALTTPPQPLLAAIARLRGDARVAAAPALHAALELAASRVAARFPAAQDALQESLRPAAGALRRQADDVLVVVYSCRKYLDSRIPVIRDTWMKDLKARGIRCLVVVGDGDDTLDGDVLALAVGDRYEDLPAKTLAIVKWVLANTRCQYLVKIDDDCLLNVPAYFDDLVYREFHYYGRVLRRDKGGMNRRWHQERSQGELARHALDKSPEPSSYADGGGGYCLSRFAMARMLATAATPAGARLVFASYMEDKLAGDLLSLAGIVGRTDDYHTQVRRRYGSNAEPVSVFENSFFPSRDYPAKLSHLDTPAHMHDAWQRLDAPGLWPKKLWPSLHPASIDYGNANQLELLTPLGKARALLEQPMFVVAVMRNEKTMLPHFLAHYRGMGVRAFIIADNLSDDGTRETLMAQPDVVLYSADTEYRKSEFGVAWQHAILASHCMNRWALVADADELLVCPGGVDLPTYTAGLARDGYDMARVFMIDMYPEGDLASADFEREDPFRAAPWFDREAVVSWHLGAGSYNNAGNYVSGLRHRLIPSAEPNSFTAQKYCLMRYAPWMRLCAGMHYAANTRVAPVSAWFAHFKYHAGFKARVAAEVARQQHYGGAAEYRRYQELLAEGQGSFAVEGVSARYGSPDDFARIPIVDDA